jgi:hypothetical protein
MRDQRRLFNELIVGQQAFHCSHYRICEKKKQHKYWSFSEHIEKPVYKMILESNLIVLYAQMRKISQLIAVAPILSFGGKRSKDIQKTENITKKQSRLQKSDLRAYLALSSTEHERDTMSSKIKLVYGEDHSTLYCDLLP